MIILLPTPLVYRLERLALSTFPDEAWALIQADHDHGGFRPGNLRPLQIKVTRGLHILSAEDRISLDRTDVFCLFHSHVGRAPALSEPDLDQMVTAGMPSYPISHLIYQVAADGSRVVRTCFYVWDPMEGRYARTVDLTASRREPVY